VTPSPFEHLISTGLKQIAHTTRMAFTGDVDPRHKAHKISSQQAHQRVKKRLQMALGFFAVVLSVITVRVGLLQTVQRGDYLA